MDRIEREIYFLNAIHGAIKNNRGKLISYSMTEAKRIRTLDYLITELPDRPTVDLIWSNLKDLFNRALYAEKLKVFHTCDYETKDHCVAHIYSGPQKTDSLRINATDNSLRITLTYKVYGNY